MNPTLSANRYPLANAAIMFEECRVGRHKNRTSIVAGRETEKDRCTVCRGGKPMFSNRGTCRPNDQFDAKGVLQVKDDPPEHCDGLDSRGWPIEDRFWFAAPDKILNEHCIDCKLGDFNKGP